MKNINNKTTAFSLIELSIVLIIIGLLVAGVTGGKSLIESAKTRALMNEIRNYNQAFTTFYIANGRLPGDANRDGKVDQNDDSFYDFKDKDKYKDTRRLSIAAPWAELYDEKIIDFYPTSSCQESSNYYEGKISCYPKSKVFKDFHYDIAADGYMDGVDAFLSSSDNNWEEYANKAKIKIKNNNSDYKSALLKVNIVKQIDEKIDDSERNNGRFRAICGLLGDDGYFEDDYYYDNYDLKYDDILNDGRCQIMNYILDIN